MDSTANSSATVLKTFTFDDYAKFIGNGGFRSKEELLQIFYNVYFSGTVTDLKMERKDIAQLADSIRTLFPLDRCTSISERENRLSLEFDGPQRVTGSGIIQDGNASDIRQGGFYGYP